VQTSYFGFSIINDIFGSNTWPSEYRKDQNIPTLQRFRDFIAASIVFPGSLVTVAINALHAFAV